MPWPDVLELLTGYLTPILAPVPVTTRVPDPRPAALVQLRRVGGAATPPVRDTTRVDAWCWAATEADAHDLAVQVRAAVWALPGTLLAGVPVYRVEEVMAPRQQDDPVTGTPRYWATYTLVLRADEAIHRRR